MFLFNYHRSIRKKSLVLKSCGISMAEITVMMEGDRNPRRNYY